MKHSLKITAVLISIFFIAQLVGLFIIYQDLKVNRTVTEAGEIQISVSHPETAFGERPNVKNFDALVLILASVLIGTSAILLIVKFGLKWLWKGIFFLAIFFAVGISLGTFLNPFLAAIIAIILAALKTVKPNVIIHNLTEVLIYSGIAVLFVPLLEPLWILILLFIISGYDMFAVWKSKHMVKLAEFQVETKAFAGLFIPSSGKMKKGSSKGQGTTAIVGGGDIAFPLIFAGSVMEFLISSGLGNSDALLRSIIISVFATIALLGLMIYAEKGKYYPAMPFITGGLVIGYLIALFV